MQAVRQPVVREVGALLLALGLAPLAAVALNSVIVFLLMGAFGVINTPQAPPGVFLVAETFALIARDLSTVMIHAHAVAWLVIYPQVLVLKARGWLSLGSVLASAVIFPLATASTLTLLFWSGTSATTNEMLAIFALLVGTTVPGAVAIAAAFWTLYSVARGPSAGAITVPRETSF